MQKRSEAGLVSPGVEEAGWRPSHDAGFPISEAPRPGRRLRPLRRLARLLFVLNPAACWLLARRGRRIAFDYLHHLWTLYLWPELLPMCATDPLLPAAPVEKLFPGIDLTRIELLHALPRPGGVRLEELVILNALVRHLKPRRLVEIGTAEGRTTLNLIFHAPADAELLTVDLPPEAPAAALESGKDYRQFGIAEPGMLFLRHPLAARIRRLLVDSTAVDWASHGRAVDFAFIDGDHSYESVRQDSENLLGVLRGNGVILWHDYGVVDGVTRHLNELQRRWPVVWIADTSLACLRVEG